jgi:hypothetical protein
MWRSYVRGTVDDHLLDCGHGELVRSEALIYIASVLSERVAAFETR